jgi:hypothetical protein
MEEIFSYWSTPNQSDPRSKILEECRSILDTFIGLPITESTKNQMYNLVYSHIVNNYPTVGNPYIFLDYQYFQLHVDIQLPDYNSRNFIINPSYFQYDLKPKETGPKVDLSPSDFVSREW